jgi:hypothetical protein
MKSKLIYLGVIIFLFSFSIVSADDTEFAGEGETVWPIESKEIEMVAETVLVQPAEIGWDADCIFILRNTGESTEVQVGFPDQTKRSPGEESTQGTIENFRCFIDETQVQVEHKNSIQSPLDPEIEYPYAYVWIMSFKKGQTRKVINSFSFKGMFSSDGLNTLVYVLRTGSLWKGTIKKGLIEFNLGEIDPHFCSFIKPVGYVIKKNKIRWTFSDFEPKEDVWIGYYRKLQSWANSVDKFIDSDSIEVLKELLAVGLSCPDPYFSPDLIKYFNNKIEKIIDKVKPFMDVQLYELLLAKNRGDKEDVRRRCKKYLKQFIAKENFTFEEETVLFHCTSISMDFLKDFSLVESFLKIQLCVIDYKISNLKNVPYLNTENEYKKLTSERESILHTIDLYKQNELKK